jgi:plasmid stability protein
VSSLLIRNVDDALRGQLEARAHAPPSLEEEARETLRTAIASDAGRRGSESLMQIATRLFGPARGLDADLPPRGTDIARTSADFSGPEYDR